MVDKGKGYLEDAPGQAAAAPGRERRQPGGRQRLHRQLRCRHFLAQSEDTVLKQDDDQ